MLRLDDLNLLPVVGTTLIAMVKHKPAGKKLVINGIILIQLMHGQILAGINQQPAFGTI